MSRMQYNHFYPERLPVNTVYTVTYLPINTGHLLSH